MYKIIVVEDEPTALNHVCMILERKCPQYQVIGTAENGQEALDMIQKEPPDVLLTDVKMPVMDGIQLVTKVKEEFPEILSVIISGYSDFEYAKGALRSGVCDYLLKPLAPSDMKKLMEKLEFRLHAYYYEERNKLLRALCNGSLPEKREVLRKFFPAGRYYVAIYRKNGLRKRFLGNTDVEIFTMEEESLYIYGRDEMEALYLIPETLLFSGDFAEMADGIFLKENKEETYLTAIIYETPFVLEDFPEVAKLLYRELDKTIVIGIDQKVRLTGDSVCEKDIAENEEEQKQLEYVEYLIQYKEEQKLLLEIEKFFRILYRERRNQIYVEGMVRYIFQLIRKKYLSGQSFMDIEIMLDDAFYYACNMQELTENVLMIVKQCIPELGKEKIGNKEQLFHSITSYLDGHMAESLTLGKICKYFGVSQSTLSKMFRTYEETSFSNYLTKIRIEKAESMMRQDPDAYIRDIADRCGYNDQFYFSRIFRSVTGTCPKEYMEHVKSRINHK